MSYDLNLGGEYRNYTSNLAKFFHEFISHDDGTGLQSLNGLTGEQAANVIRCALGMIRSEGFHTKEGQSCYDHFSKYNPENNWGDVMSAVLFLTDLLFLSQDFPEKVWQVSA